MRLSSAANIALDLLDEAERLYMKRINPNCVPSQR